MEEKRSSKLEREIASAIPDSLSATEKGLSPQPNLRFSLWLCCRLLSPSRRVASKTFATDSERERQVFSLLRAMRTESLSVSCACTLNRLVFLGRLMKPYKESNWAVARRATPAKPSAETYVKISAPWRAIPATIPAGNFVTLYAQLKGDPRETISGKPRQFLCPMEGPLQRNISWKICLVLCHSVITEYFNHKCSLSKEELVFPDYPSVNASVSFIRDDWIVTTPFPSLTSKPGQGWIPFQVRQTLYLAPSMFLGPSHNARNLLLTGSYWFPPVPP